MGVKTIQFKAEIKKFGQMGEKTGWTYIEVPATLATGLMPSNKKSFRVKGKIDALVISGVALIPMGEGDFILPLNLSIRKEIRKQKGQTVNVKLQLDTEPYQLNKELVACLEDEQEAKELFYSYPVSHQNYYSKWIESAKTEETKIKRITQTVIGLSKGMNYPEMIRYFKTNKMERL